MYFAITDAGTGEITQTISSPQSNLAESGNVTEVSEAVFSNYQLYYEDDAQKILRPTNPATLTNTIIAANGTDTTTLTNLPDPCTVTFTGPGISLMEDVTGGTATFTTDTLGAHTVKVVAFPYLDWEGTFNAV
jgi:hypothetical protein